MIYTITFNPSLDYIMHVDCFEEGETNRSKQEEIYPGGKGFNVSTILSRLNLETTALGFVAGFTGEEIVKELKERNIEKPKKDKPKDAYNFNPLNSIIERLKENNLKVKVEKNYFKIEFNSQEEVDKITSYFNIQS